MTAESFKPARAHRFTMNIDGSAKVGLLFDSEQDLDRWLLDRGIANDPKPFQERSLGKVGRGRPSHDAAIAAAIAALGTNLDAAGTLAECARLVHRELAHHVGADDMPELRTIERYLARANLVRQKSRQKSDRA